MLGRKLEILLLLFGGAVVLAQGTSLTATIGNQNDDLNLASKHFTSP